jgi:putative hydrolase of the HAD superfamily
VEFVPEEAYRRGLEEGCRLAYDWLREHGKPLPRYEEFARRERRALFWGQFWARLTGRELRAQQVVLETLARMGIEVLPEEIYDLTDRSYRPFGDMLRPRADAAKVLQEVAALGLRLAAVSNTAWPGYLIEEDLARFGLKEHLGFCLFSSYFGRPKPARSIFRQALRMLKVSAAEALFVGDSAREDMRGARRVGMRTVFISNGSNGSSEPRAHWRIGELPALLPIVRQLAHHQPSPRDEEKEHDRTGNEQG